MPRPADPELEERILRAAEVLWRRGGDRTLSMRSVARVAATKTPAVYRRFKNRQELMRALLLRIAQRTRQHFDEGRTLQQMAEVYLDTAIRMPHEYRLFYSYAAALSPKKGRGEPPPIRESRPNFAYLEQRLAQALGGVAEDHTQLALAMWATLHGTAMLLLSRSIPEGHEEALRQACLGVVKKMVESAKPEPGQQ
jgi:AcrR family transcriptional regulator